MRKFVTSVKQPSHPWFKVNGFRALNVEWEYGGGKDVIGAVLHVGVGEFHSSIRWTTEQCVVMRLTVWTWPTVFSIRAHGFLAWVHGTPFDAMSCRIAWHDSAEFTPAEVVPEFDYSVLRAMAEQTTRGMPAEVFVDWLRTAMPQADRFIEDSVTLERGLQAARSRTRSEV